MIHIRTLGPVAVLTGGIPPPPELLWRKHLALLIYLACSPRRTRTRQHLLGLLWSDRSDSAARHSLNEALRIIRRAAGADAIVTAADQVTLARPVELDLDEIQAAAGTGDLDGAAALVTGEFLEGFGIPGASEFEDWLVAERRIWRTRGAEILARRAAELARAGDSENGRLVAERAARLDPEAEPVARTAVEVLAQGGDVPGALAHYERYRATLAATLDVSPSDDFAALAERLRRLPQPRLRRAPAPAGLERRRAPLVGREPELARLRAAWATARGGRAAVVVLSGDLGTGKTRLVEELVRLTVIEGAVTAVARAVEADRGSPGAGIMALARDRLVDAHGVAGARLEALAAFAGSLPEWGDRFPSARAASPLALGPALTDVIESVSGEAPVVLAIDDAEWSDGESVLALEALVRDLRNRPVLIVFALAPYPRRAEMDRLETRLGHDVPGELVLIEPLGAAAIGDLAGRALPGMDQAALERMTRRIMADTGGYPLLAVDLLDAIALGLDSTPGAEGWPRAAATLTQTLPGDLPDAVVAAVRVGFRRLSADAQAVLGAASAGGDRIDPERLTTMLDLPPDRIDAALDELEWSRWLAADARGYTFRARLIQKIVARDFTTGSMRRRWLARTGSN